MVALIMVTGEGKEVMGAQVAEVFSDVAGYKVADDQERNASAQGAESGVAVREPPPEEMTPPSLALPLGGGTGGWRKFLGFRLSYRPLELELQKQQSHTLQLTYFGVAGGWRYPGWRFEGEVIALRYFWFDVWNDELTMSWRGWGGRTAITTHPFELWLTVQGCEPLAAFMGLTFLRMMGQAVGPNISLPGDISGEREVSGSDIYTGKAASYEVALQHVYADVGVMWHPSQPRPAPYHSWVQSWGVGARVLLPLHQRYRDTLVTYTGEVEEDGHHKVNEQYRQRDIREIPWALDLKITLEE